MAADDQQLGRLGLLQQLVGRPVRHDHPAHRHVGIALLPPRQALAEGLLPHRLHGRPIHAGEFEHPGIAPGVHGHQVDPAERRLLEGDLQGVFGCGRTVHAHHHRRLRRVRHQRILVVDDRDRAVRVMDQAGADRSQQSAPQSSAAVAADHHHLGAGGQIGQHRDGRSADHLGGHLQPRITGRLPRRQDRLLQQLGPLALLPLQIARRHGHVGKCHHHRRLQDADQLEGHAAAGGVTRRPVDRNPRRRRIVDTDDHRLCACRS